MTTATAAAGCSPRRVAVIQDGARLHYAVPIALQQAGLLERAYTNWYAPPGSLARGLARAISFYDREMGRKMLGRYAPALRAQSVTAFLSQTWKERRARERFSSDTAFFQWASKSFADRVMAAGLGGADALFGFVRNVHPDLCRYARERGLRTIGDQMIAPAAVELAEERMQRERFPEWPATPPVADDESLPAFEARTWEQLDHITCASAYVRDGLLKQGIDAAKISVMPYPIEASQYPVFDRTQRGGGPLTVGFVGSVGLRKGAPYFARVARRFAGRLAGDARAVRFAMIGPVDLSPAGTDALRSAGVELRGRVPRSHVLDELKGFDVFLFPTTCEGSAGAVMEAMATGLPVVTTPQAGSLVRDGVSGSVVPYDDEDGMAVAVERLLASAELRRSVGIAARADIERCDIAAYGRQWATMLSSLPVPKRPSRC